MASLSTTTNSIASRAASDEGHLRRGVLPSWLASIWLHIFLLIVAMFGLRSCTGTGDRGEAVTEWKTVGLVTRAAASGVEAEAPSAETAETSAQVTEIETSDVPAFDEKAFDSPPTSLAELSDADLPEVIGPGAGVPSFAASAPESSISTGAIATGSIAPAGLARGETEFLGIRDSGQTFVYVVDISGSMSSPPEAMAAAKIELMTSLASLNADQQFQIIFYNERPHLMRLPGKPPEKLYTATDINRTLARQMIASVQPDLGTSHMPAMKAALEIEPDVIFFLTDAEDPALSAKDLDQIRRANNDKARIHAVEFGKGAKLNSSSALERLAQQNGGAYQYRDVMRLRR